MKNIFDIDTRFTFLCTISVMKILKIKSMLFEFFKVESMFFELF
eukprot:UN07800